MLILEKRATTRDTSTQHPDHDVMLPLKSRTQLIIAALLANIAYSSAQDAAEPQLASAASCASASASQNTSAVTEVNISRTPLPYVSAIQTINQWTAKVSSDIPSFDYAIKIQPCDATQPPIVYNGKYDTSMHLVTDRPAVIEMVTGIMSNDMLNNRAKYCVDMQPNAAGTSDICGITLEGDNIPANLGAQLTVYTNGTCAQNDANNEKIAYALAGTPPMWTCAGAAMAANPDLARHTVTQPVFNQNEQGVLQIGKDAAWSFWVSSSAIEMGFIVAVMNSFEPPGNYGPTSQHWWGKMPFAHIIQPLFNASVPPILYSRSQG